MTAPGRIRIAVAAFSGALIVCLAVARSPRLVGVGAQGASTKQTGGNREAAYRANNLGVARLEQYDYASAVAAFRQAIALDPDIALAHVNLAIALF